MNNEQWEKIEAAQKKWRKEEKFRDRVENSKLYWIFDSRIEETHQINPRDTQQEYGIVNEV